MYLDAAAYRKPSVRGRTSPYSGKCVRSHSEPAASVTTDDRDAKSTTYANGETGKQTPLAPEVGADTQIVTQAIDPAAGPSIEAQAVIRVAKVFEANAADPILCYVDDDLAYFTTKCLDDQWGDDWNDAPYEHNAGGPYGPLRQYRGFDHETKSWYIGSEFQGDAPLWRIVRVRFPGEWLRPAGLVVNALNSPWSVQDINTGLVPWLTRRDGPTIQSWRRIYAGTPLSAFLRRMEALGFPCTVLP